MALQKMNEERIALLENELEMLREEVSEYRGKETPRWVDDSLIN